MKIVITFTALWLLAAFVAIEGRKTIVDVPPVITTATAADQVEYIDPATHPDQRPLTEEEFRKLQQELKRDAMLKKIDADFRRYMAANHPEIPAAEPGKQWQPYYDVWIGKHWRDYPGFWDGDWALPFIPTEDPISTPPKQDAAPTAPVQVCDPRKGNCGPAGCGTSSRPTYIPNRGGLLRRFLFRR